MYMVTQFHLVSALLQKGSIKER